MGDILVIGLAGRTPSDDWQTLLNGRSVVARNTSAARRALPEGIRIDRSFDSTFDEAEPGVIPQLVVDALIALAGEGNVAYCTPGMAVIGDAIVPTLGTATPITIHPGTLPGTPINGAATVVVDALALACAEQHEPFIGGLPAIDATLPTLVTNVGDSPIADLALCRLQRIYGTSAAPTRIDADTLVFPALDPLAAFGSLAALTHIVARLRRPDGCPWDREQTARSLLPALAEEADELREAIEAGVVDDIVEELGDVLVNLLLQAQLASESGAYRFDDAVRETSRKLVRRHPHVFAGQRAATSAEVLDIWRTVKDEEKSARIARAGTAGGAGTGNSG